LDYLLIETRRMSSSARRLIRSLNGELQRRQLNAEISDKYAPSKVLLMYGPGGPTQQAISAKHQGDSVFFDLGYWDRKLPNRHYRVSINRPHPIDIMSVPKYGAGRNTPKIKTVKIKSNNILLIGNAPKSIAFGAKNWTAEKSKEIRRLFPNQKIIYRPKPKRPMEPGVIYDDQSIKIPINTALRDCGLVVCRHSNVAIDACLLGVPVVCDDGAAAGIYPSDLEHWENQPTLAERIDFIERLAYYQWDSNESKPFFNWLFATYPKLKL